MLPDTAAAVHFRQLLPSDTIFAGSILFKSAETASQRWIGGTGALFIFPLCTWKERKEGERKETRLCVCFCHSRGRLHFASRRRGKGEEKETDCRTYRQIAEDEEWKEEAVGHAAAIKIGR